MTSETERRDAQGAAAVAFDDPPFDQRLAVFLAALRPLIGAHGAALVEVDALDGHLAPRVRASSGLEATLDAAVPEDVFARWLAAGSATVSLDALGGGFVGAQGRVVGLSVAPRWWAGRDAALCLTGPDSVPEALIERLEAALSQDRDRRTSALLRAALESAADTVELTDVSVRVVHVNNAFERLFGYTRAEVVGDDLVRLRDPSAPKHDPLFYRFAEETVNARGVWLSTIGSRRKDGQSVMAEIAVTFVDAPALRFKGNLGIRRDAQQRAARDSALSMAHLEFRTVLGALPQAVAVIRDERVYFGNAPFFEILGVRPETAMSASFESFMHPDERPRLEALLRDGAGGLRIVRPDATVRIVDVNGVGEISFEGAPSRILLLEDTTDQRFEQARDEHAQRLAALGALAASVAHEINNPLAVLTSNLEWLMECAALPDEHSALEDALEGARRIRQIISDLRAFSRDDAASHTAESVDVSRALSAALNIAANELRHLARVEVKCPPHVMARGKDGPLVQVLVNLLVNASQAMRTVKDRPHLLTVSVAEAQGFIDIDVVDTGPGIPAELMSRLFAPFVSTRASSGGTGLGLWISRRIIESFGGELTVTSTPGTGSTFRVHLSAGATTVPPPRSPPSASARGATVLVIDDEVAVARALDRLLSAEHSVEVISDSPAALRRLVSEPAPQVVLCDLMMPTLNGVELYERACAARPELRERFVFVTGGAFTDDTSAFLAQTRAPVVGKPFDAAELRRAVASRLAPG